MRLRSALSSNLKRLRKERSLTQEALAHSANLERSYISKLERKLSSASIDTLEKIADALSIEPSDLLVRDTP